MDTITGELGRPRFANPENGFLIAPLRCEDSGDEVTIKGACVPSAMPRQGSRLRVSGEWVDDPKWGRQFAFKQAEELQPETTAGLQSYLEHYLPGIGRARAAEIVKRFGAEALATIEHDPGALLSIKGITEQVARQMSEQVKAHGAEREAMTELAGWNMTPRAIDKVSAHYGSASAAAQAIKANPYKLAELVDGYGFHKADAIALRLGFGTAHPFRVQEGIMYAMREAAYTEGHTLVPGDDLVRRACDPSVLGAVDGNVIEDAALALQDVDRIYRGLLLENTSTAFLPVLSEAEGDIAERLNRLNNHEHPAPLTEWPDSLGLNEEQAAFLASFADLGAGLLVLTGGAGVGKTFTIRALLDTADANHLTCALVAPTGKAAKRITEQTGRPASTIHRFLQWEPPAGFALEQVRQDVLIVDESSMVDSPLMAELLRRVDPAHTRVVLVGDVEQLPPVGPGQPFRDLIASQRFPVHRLTRIMRTAEDSLIPLNSQAVLRGESKLQFDHRQFAFIEAEEPHDAAAAIENLCRPQALEGAGLTPADVQVLSPMRKGPIGTWELNRRLAPLVNPGGEKINGFPGFRTGDRVIFGRNDYQAGWVNGDQGWVQGANDKTLQVALDGGGSVHVPTGKLDDLSLAYAITVHKSQGSEYPCVIVPVHTSHFIMLQRGLLYTAITRGKMRVVLVGSRRAIGIAVRNIDTAKRMTLLQELLHGCQPGGG